MRTKKRMEKRQRRKRRRRERRRRREKRVREVRKVGKKRVVSQTLKIDRWALNSALMPL